MRAFGNMVHVTLIDWCVPTFVNENAFSFLDEVSLIGIANTATNCENYQKVKLTMPQDKMEPEIEIGEHAYFVYKGRLYDDINDYISVSDISDEDKVILLLKYA